jgi:flavin reductase (DIM6/NTAB) family NADH-FMN oxidoreductase RutF
MAGEYSEIAEGIENFKLAMRKLAGAVTVVATSGHGITATAVCSVSAEPPSLLVCANRENQFSQMVQQNRFFSVNVLQNEQIELSNVFAGFTDVAYAQRFESGDWQISANGCPYEQNALVCFECELDKVFSYGTHDILIGKVIATRIGQGRPLLYYQRDYVGLAETSV